MPKLYGTLTADANTKIAIVASRFNELIVNNLVAGAVDRLKRLGLPEENITITWVPGAFEIPLVAKTLASSGEYQAVICLGAVIRGATPHFDYVAGQAAAGILQTSLKTDIPIIFGVLTTETIEQALERAGSKAGNKGADSAETALEMVSLMGQLTSRECTHRI